MAVRMDPRQLLVENHDALDGLTCPLVMNSLR